LSKAKGVVRLACLPSCAATLLPDVIARFQLDHPAVTFEVEDALNSSIITLVREDRVDFGIGMADENDGDIEQIKLFDDAMMVVHPEGHPIAAAPTISVETLAAYPADPDEPRQQRARPGGRRVHRGSPTAHREAETAKAHRG